MEPRVGCEAMKCPQCRYEVDISRYKRCPECGAPLPRQRVYVYGKPRKFRLPIEVKVLLLVGAIVVVLIVIWQFASHSSGL